MALYFLMYPAGISNSDAAGALVRDCVVVVFAQDPQRWTSQTRYVVSSRPDPDNLFHLRLPAGDYFAVAFEEPDTSTPFNDPDVLKQLRDRAIMISIGDAAPTKLALKLSEPPVF